MKMVKCESCGKEFPADKIKEHKKGEPQICKYC
jgi:DNA-directed RNA polymerase subunit RPC12/RpoP